MRNDYLDKEPIIYTLKSLHLYEKAKSGGLFCFFCKNAVDLDTIEAVFFANDFARISCYRSECHNKWVSLRKGITDVDQKYY